MTPESGFFYPFQHPQNSNLSIVLDSDGRVVYAYMLDGASIVCDVWLYNIAATPASLQGFTEADLPFLNSRQYAKPASDCMMINHPEHVSVTWEEEEDEIRALIYVSGYLLAMLQHGYRPGWCVNALTGGPMAKVIM